jgi:hypothetical protein
MSSYDPVRSCQHIRRNSPADLLRRLEIDPLRPLSVKLPHTRLLWVQLHVVAGQQGETHLFDQLHVKLLRGVAREICGDSVVANDPRSVGDTWIPPASSEVLHETDPVRERTLQNIPSRPVVGKTRIEATGLGLQGGSDRLQELCDSVSVSGNLATKYPFDVSTATSNCPSRSKIAMILVMASSSLLPIK